MKELPQVKLRAVEPEDLDVLYLIENDPELWDVGVTNVPYSRFVLHEYIANISGNIYADGQVRLVVCNAEGETVGMVDLINFNPRHNRAEVGIVIQKPYQNKGYGMAALSRLIHYSRTILHLHQLYALVSVNNTKSMRTFEEIGFQRDAELADWLYDGTQYHTAIVMQYFL
jgi:diamine N-acetyltransferase